MQHGTPIASYIHTNLKNLRTQTTTHIGIKSKKERDTISGAELAAMTVALDLCKESPQIQLVADCAFNINTLRNYVIHSPYTQRTTTLRQQPHEI
jgi:hypothetical protein